MRYAHEQMAVTAEGTLYNLPDTAAGVVTAHALPPIEVLDGELTLFFDDLGGPNPTDN